MCIKKLKFSRYRPGVAQRVGRGIALLFHDRGTRREWVVSSTLRPHFTTGKDPVPIVQEAGWAPGPVWTGGKSRPHRDSIPDRPARSQLLYRLSYPAHYIHAYYITYMHVQKRWLLAIRIFTEKAQIIYKKNFSLWIRRQATDIEAFTGTLECHRTAL